MKTKTLFLLPALIVVFNLMLSGRVPAQTFKILHRFEGSDGSIPSASLSLSGNTLYGTTPGVGGSHFGTVFAVNTDGTGFTNLHRFTASSTNSLSAYTNNDGVNLESGLILSGRTLYGTAADGGRSGFGTVFAINTNGTGFTNLHSFTYDEGIYPYAGLLLSGNTLYGTVSDDFTENYGTVFSISFRPQLTIAVSRASVILSWPTNVAGFDYTGYTLQATTNLASPTLWSTHSTAPVIVNGQNIVTPPIIGAQKFYRLSQ